VTVTVLRAVSMKKVTATVWSPFEVPFPEKGDCHHFTHRFHEKGDCHRFTRRFLKKVTVTVLRAVSMKKVTVTVSRLFVAFPGWN